jgi:propionate catabolism operon transcriptional regulator
MGFFYVVELIDVFISSMKHCRSLCFAYDSHCLEYETPCLERYAMNATDSANPITIWCVSALDLADLLSVASLDYAPQARVRIIKEHFEDAVTAISELQKHERCDVLLSAGANAEYLRQHLSIPVVTVRIGGFDVMAALHRARLMSSAIAVMFYREIPAELPDFLHAFHFNVDIDTYQSEDEARRKIDAFRARGIEVIVGAGLALDLARGRGMSGVFIYSKDSASVAFETAINVALAQRIEQNRGRMLASVLRHVQDGVIAIDDETRIIAYNAAAMTFTGGRIFKAEGRLLSSVVPELAPFDNPASEDSDASTVLDISGQGTVIDANPFMESGRRIGRVLTLRRAIAVEGAFHRLRAHESAWRPQPRYKLADIVQASAQMRGVVRKCHAVAAHRDTTALITGPSGVGKELLAQGIHNASARSKGPFVPFNCGAVTESLSESELFGYDEGAFTGAKRSGKPGLFEAAHQGTIFLDEIAELTPAMQTRLLRVIQEREITRVGGTRPIPVDVRIIAATHRDLGQMIKDGTFRDDLYYRIAVVLVDVSPLRERPEDLLELARRQVKEALSGSNQSAYLNAVTEMIPDLLGSHDWPGNGRELENFSLRVAVVCTELGRPPTAKELAGLISMNPSASNKPQAADLASMRRDQEKNLAIDMVKRCGGNQSEAAKKLGISRSTLWRKLNGQ